MTYLSGSWQLGLLASVPRTMNCLGTHDDNTRALARTGVVARVVTDGVGTPDPNLKQFVIWCV